MKRERASLTATWVAACRGLGPTLPEGARLAEDPFGLRFGRAPARAVAAAFGGFPRLADLAVRRAGAIGHLLLWLQVRTRVLDDVLLAFAGRGGAQVVLLGAGFDCRAARFARELSGATVFEVDHPATQAEKRRVLESAGARAGRVEYLDWDFEERPMAELGSALAGRGHDATRPTLTIWEGVTMYLSEAAVDASVAAVRDLSAPGSELALTYFDRARVERPSGWGRTAARVVGWVGEPFRFGWDPRELPGWLEPRGFALLWDRSGEELARGLLAPRYRVLAEESGRIALARRGG